MAGVARLIAIGTLTVISCMSAAAQDALSTGPSKLPLPRFVSLGSDEVNVRIGPSVNHRIKFTFTKSGLPVEIVREFGNWRRVRDSEGDEGWVHGSLLSGRRTVLVSPWSGGENVPLRATPAASAAPTALLEPLVLASVDNCDGSWCEIEGNGFHGQVPQRMLWGVYPKELLN